LSVFLIDRLVGIAAGLDLTVGNCAGGNKEQTNNEAT
jgi:hypothetical protein